MLRAWRSTFAFIVPCLFASLFAADALAAPPWATLVPFKKIDADPNKKPDSSQRLLGLRTIYSMMSTSPDKREKGPMGAAFVTRNPLLPEELFVAKGLDPFVYDMNKDLPHSLLKCPGKFTVRIAS